MIPSLYCTNRKSIFDTAKYNISLDLIFMVHTATSKIFPFESVNMIILYVQKIAQKVLSSSMNFNTTAHN